MSKNNINKYNNKKNPYHSNKYILKEYIKIKVILAMLALSNNKVIIEMIISHNILLEKASILNFNHNSNLI